MLKRRGTHDYGLVDEATRHAADVLTASLSEFNIQAEVTGIRKGPVITLYEVLPAPGVRVSKIANLSDNIALRLAAPSVRIVAPIPGKHAVGIEVPNRERAIVSFREMVDLAEMQDARHEIPIALGKDILGKAQVIDLVQTPHLLIGGATNSGKSVLVNVDHLLDPLPPVARGGAPLPRRPEDRRAEELQRRAAPADARHHRAAQGLPDAAVLHLGDGAALHAARRARAPATSGSTTARRRSSG